MQVTCLLYADDLVILSETKEGLQRSLDSLSQFTQKWHLEVNTKKTKCLTFAQGRRVNTTGWVLGDMPSDTCNTYCYLRVLFTGSGSMKTASKALHDKALGATFSLICNINKHNTCSINITCYLTYLTS